MSARAVADRAATHAGAGDSQVALIVVLLLATAGLLAVAFRFVGRRSPPAGAA